MFERLKPDMIINSIREFPLEKLVKMGIKGIVFDIDNTLVKASDKEPTLEVLELFDKLKGYGISYSIVSNNSIERVERFSKNLGVYYRHKALKPRRKYLRQAMDYMGTTPETTALVGDQLFTDIYGGNRMGFLTVFTLPLGESETKFVEFKRKLEKMLLK